MNAIIEARFADPVHDSQKAFRALMDAMAGPGRAQLLIFAAVPPAPLTAELAAIALTLADQDTPVWLDTALGATPAVAEWLAFHTGAPVTADPARAGLALATSSELLPPFARFARGSDEYPDRSSLVAVQVGGFEGGPELRLNGPGILDSVVVSPRGLPDNFVHQWGENGEMYPRGIDLLVVAPGAVIGLPRSTRVEG